MGDGNQTPVNVDVSRFSSRMTNSISSLTKNAAASVRETLAGNHSKVSNISSVDRQATFSDSSFVEMSDSETVEPGTSVRVDSPTGDEIYVVAEHHSDGTFEVFQNNSEGIKEIASGEDNLSVTHVADPSKMSFQEYTQHMKDTFAATLDTYDLSESHQEFVVEEVQENFIDTITEQDVLSSFVDKQRSIVNKNDGLVARGTRGYAFHTGNDDVLVSVDMDYQDRQNVLIHEYAHSLAYSQGYNVGHSFSDEVMNKSPSSVAQQHSGGLPDFGGEYEFGETVSSFDSFMMSHGETGYIPKHGEAVQERAVANASYNDYEFSSTPADGAETIQVAESLAPGDVIEYESQSNGETYVGVITRDDRDYLQDGINQFSIVNLHDSNGNPITENDELNDKKGFITYNTVVDEHKGNIHSVVDKQATAEKMGYDVQNSETPDSVNTRFDDFMGEINKQWARVASYKEAGYDSAADSFIIDDTYSTTHAHETIAGVFEQMYSNVEQDRLNKVIQSNPELAQSMSNVMDITDNVEIPEKYRTQM